MANVLEPAAAKGGRSVLWWIYFAYVLGTFAFWVASVAPQLVSMPRPLQVAAVFFMVLDAWAVVGLWAYLRWKALGSEWIWIICSGLKAAHLLATSIQIAQIGGLDPANVSSLYDALPLCGLLLGIPLLLALFRYGFCSKEIWRATTEAS